MKGGLEGWLAEVLWGAGDLPGRAPGQGLLLQLPVRKRAESIWSGWARGGRRQRRGREGLGKRRVQREAHGDGCPWSILSRGSSAVWGRHAGTIPF